MEAVRTHRWYRLHWATWLATVLECAAIAHTQFVSRFEMGWSSGTYVNVKYFGWPVFHGERIESGPTYAPSPAPKRELNWDLPSFTFNCVCWFILVTAVALVVELWSRKQKRWQFSLRGLGMFVVVLGTLLTLAKNRNSLRQFGFGIGPFAAPDLIDLIETNWSETGALLFGLGCLIGLVVAGLYVVSGWLLRLVAGRFFSTIQPNEN